MNAFIQTQLTKIDKDPEVVTEHPEPNPEKESAVVEHDSEEEKKKEEEENREE